MKMPMMRISTVQLQPVFGDRNMAITSHHHHIVLPKNGYRALLKMRCDDRTNHRSLQRCDWSQRLLGAKVTLNCHFYSCAIMRGHFTVL